MDSRAGAGPEGIGPFPFLEPAALLAGADAVDALHRGYALPLQGGPLAFALVRTPAGLLPALEARARYPAALARLTAAAGGWAGLGPGPLVMGILNATPDSFSDGGTIPDPVATGLAMLQAGADIIDVGGESTRPGAIPVPPDEERHRILPVIEALARAGATLSVDTRNAATMARALDAGARIVNDVSAGAWDPATLTLLARRRCPVILMHMRGTPQTMRTLATYADLVPNVVAELAARLEAAENAGILADQVALDPGFGFAKTADQSLELLRRLPALVSLGRPLVTGISRKNMIGMLTGEPVAARRDPGSLAAHLLCLDRGARILRVHDVRGTRQAVDVWKAVNAPPTSS